MTRWLPALFVISFTCAGTAGAQTDPASCPNHAAHQAKAPETQGYTGRAALAIKALTPEQIAQYRAGKGMGLAIPAELNGYPGPRHVLDLAAELELTAGQREKMQALFDAMESEAKALGEEIVSLEAKLDGAFAAGTISPEELQSLTTRIAERQGALRLAHLRTHLSAKAILSPAQVAAYNAARGYAVSEVHSGS
jgi:Spy/CpxP family protein refolding chaperone